MTRQSLPLCVEDVSTFAKSLRSQLGGREELPSHVEMLNLLAKAGGYRNFQHLKAQTEARQALAAPRPEAPSPTALAEVDFKRVRRLLRLFDTQGRLTRWPKKYSERVLCLWVLWSRLNARTTYDEKEISELIEGQHGFGDYALLRRELVDNGLVARTPDGREYKRLERQPPAEALAVLEQLKQ